MPMDGQELEGLLRAAFPEGKVLVMDLAGDGDHWAARITDHSFAGKSKVQQHQMVYRAIGEKMGGQLHALALETSTPADDQATASKGTNP